METQLQVTFRGFEHSAALDQFIRERAAELEPIAGNRLTSCHVVVERGHEHTTPLFHAKIDISMPGGVLAVNRESHDLHCHSHEDAYVAVREAFEVTRHQLVSWEHRHHGEP